MLLCHAAAVDVLKHIVAKSETSAKSDWKTHANFLSMCLQDENDDSKQVSFGGLALRSQECV